MLTHMQHTSVSYRHDQEFKKYSQRMKPTLTKMEKEDSASKHCFVASEDGVIEEEAVSELIRPFLTKTHMEPTGSTRGRIADEPGKKRIRSSSIQWEGLTEY